MDKVINVDLLERYSHPNLDKIINRLYEETNPNLGINMLSAKGFITYESGDDSSIHGSIISMRKYLTDICINIQYIFHSIKAKIHYLIDAIIYGINSENILSLARSIRSLLEHLSSLDYLINNGNKALDIINKSEDNGKIEKTIKDFVDSYELMFYNSKYFKLDFLDEKYKGENKTLHIQKLIKNSKKYFPEIKEYYDFLCEFTHPYFGTNLLVANKSLTATEIDLQTREHYIGQLFSCLRRLLEYFITRKESYSNMLAIFGGYRDSAMKDNADIKEIFAAKIKGMKGDGSSKEHAIFFTGARNGLEYAKSLVTYCKNKKIRGDQYERLIDEDGTVYYIFKKKGQPIWVKMTQ
ncbi:hypothetical protein ABEX38_29135 [Priestia megaterium]